MKRGLIYLGLFAFLTIQASLVQAEIISINGRYFADRSTVQGCFYSTGDKKGNLVVLDFRFGVGGWGEKYICEEKWEWNKIQNAISEVTIYINKRDNVHALEMLKELGFKDCRSIKD